MNRLSLEDLILQLEIACETRSLLTSAVEPSDKRDHLLAEIETGIYRIEAELSRRSALTEYVGNLAALTRR